MQTVNIKARNLRAGEHIYNDETGGVLTVETLFKTEDEVIVNGVSAYRSEEIVTIIV